MATHDPEVAVEEKLYVKYLDYVGSDVSII